MKKMIALVLILMLALCGLAATAEANDETKINCLIEDGSFIIQIDDPEGDLGWVADDMAQDDSVVKLYDADLVEDTFVVRYDPVGDGDVTVGVRHYTGIACDELHTFDLHVENGAVTESTGGSTAASPDEAVQDPYLSGRWQEQETQFSELDIAKNEARGWDVEIHAPLTHGAYVFKATVCYDCKLDAFVYDKGKFWDVPITDGEDEGELGEAKIAGATGSFTLGGTEEALTLTWYNDQSPEASVVFEKAAADAGDAVERFSDTWVADGYTAEIWYDEAEGGFACDLVIGETFAEYRDCRYDAQSDALVCQGGMRYQSTYNESTGDYDRDILSEGLTATFTEADGKLTCADSEGLLADVTFLRLDDAEEIDANTLYEGSEIYTQEDIEEAMILVEDEFSKWEGCEMHNIRYAGDACASDENLRWMNELKDKTYAQCIEILTDFHSPVNGGGAWEADTEYVDWNWWLAREEGGSWELLTWGY